MADLANHDAVTLNYPVELQRAIEGARKNLEELEKKYAELSNATNGLQLDIKRLSTEKEYVENNIREAESQLTAKKANIAILEENMINEKRNLEDITSLNKTLQMEMASEREAMAVTRKDMEVQKAELVNKRSGIDSERIELTKREEILQNRIKKIEEAIKS